MGRILVADDHDALRRGLARALAEAGHEVEEASNGNAAIETPARRATSTSS
ncbi:MAG: response regulator [Vicinamibacterales bacterium]